MQINRTLDRPLASAAVTTFFVTDMKYQRMADMKIPSCFLLLLTNISDVHTVFNKTLNSCNSGHHRVVNTVVMHWIIAFNV